jgi:hypothetical protein
MTEDAYTLREAAERLGINLSSLQQRIREGGFPGRFLTMGPDGPEHLIPAVELRRALDAQRTGGRDAWVEASDTGSGFPTARATLLPLRAAETPRSLVEDDLDLLGESVALQPEIPVVVEALQRALVDAVRTEHAGLVAALQAALASRDRDVELLRREVSALRTELGRVLELVARVPEAAAEREAWAELVSAPIVAVDMDRVVAELDALEALLARMPGA